jgi:hypothetical protein
MVYVLFYAWTAEASKMVRLLQGMLRTNASWIGDRFRWTYSEVEDVRDRDTTTARGQRSSTGDDRSSITKEFVTTIVNRIGSLLKQKTSQINKALDEIAQQIGFLRVWPNELVRTLLFEVAATIECLPPVREITTKAIKREFAKVLHPDKHPNAVGIEKQFWHELFIALEI